MENILNEDVEVLDILENFKTKKCPIHMFSKQNDFIINSN